MDLLWNDTFLRYLGIKVDDSQYCICQVVLTYSVTCEGEICMYRYGFYFLHLLYSGIGRALKEGQQREPGSSRGEWWCIKSKVESLTAVSLISKGGSVGKRGSPSSPTPTPFSLMPLSSCLSPFPAISLLPNASKLHTGVVIMSPIVTSKS